MLDKEREYLVEEYKSLNPTQITICIENVKFTCFIDQNFTKIHTAPSLRQLDRLHYHTYYELFSVKQGYIKLCFPDKELVLRAGESVLLTPKTVHRSFIDDKNVIRYNLCFVVEKTAQSTDFDLYTALINSFNGQINILKNPSICSLLQSLGERIDSGDLSEISLCFHSIINKIVDHSVYHKKQIAEHLESRGYKIFIIINQHYMDNLTIEDLAKSVFLSSRQVRRIIKKQRSCTFSQLITQMKMKSACELLKTTNMKVTEIASRVGYDSLSGFYSAFKLHHGILPKEYRKLNKTV